MKGWVGLVGWPVADGLPTIVVTHQLQVEHRTGKVRRPETDILPLCHATNSGQGVPPKYPCNGYSLRLQIMCMSWPCEVLVLSWLTVPQMGVVRVMWHISTSWRLGHIFGANEARHIKFGLQKIKGAAISHVKVLQYGVHSGSCHLLKFLEISANISEMVQDREIVT